MGSDGSRNILSCFHALHETTGRRAVPKAFRSSFERRTIRIPSAAQYDLIRKILEDPEQSSVQCLLSPAQLRDYLSPVEVSLEARLHDYITLFASLSHPFSRGNIHINSADPTSKPTMDPK